jgi:dihydropteroate synthase
VKGSRVPASLYIRPVAPLPASAVGAPGLPAIPVAGRADCAFAAAELIERDGASVRRRGVAVGELLAGSLRTEAAAILARIQAPRAPIAGLALDRPLVMGVVNVTPDSFSDGGRYQDTQAAVAHGLQLEAEGADILDIGGESTRPGAAPVDVAEELRRVLPVIEGLAGRVRVPLSIDTRNGEVMRRAAAAGARLVNDVSALTRDPDGLRAVQDTGLPVVLMHALGDPRTMQDRPRYADVVLDVYDMLAARIAACEAAGIARERLIVDPGIGFGKTLAHNLALLASLSIFHGLGCAVMLGASRKSFIGKLTGAAAGERLPGSLAAALLGAAQGVQVLRVHDVAATRQALALWQAAPAPAGPTAVV